jgi:heptosyltransferase-2
MAMLTSFLDGLAHRFPQAKIDLIVRKGLEDFPLERRGNVLVFDKEKMGAGRFGFSLRKNAYDLFYVLPPSFSAAWMAFWSGAKVRIGYPHAGRSFLLNEVHPFVHPYRSQLLVEEWLQLLSPAYSTKQFPTRLSLDDTWIKQHWPVGFAIPSDFVAVAPGGFHGPAKRWPPERMKELVQKIRAEKRSVVLLGAVSDKPACDFIAGNDSGIVNLSGKTNLLEMIAILSSASLLVSNDSGPAHIRAAFKKKQICIFGSTTPVWSAPQNPLSDVVYEKQPCSPCFDRTCRYGHYDCLNKISVDRVFQVYHEQN